jgi:uncharacterized Zn finger protein (UPF0148 family)
VRKEVWKMNKCPICEKEFETEAELQEHLAAEHPEAAGGIADQPEDGMDEAREQTDEMMEAGQAERAEETPTV